MPISDAEKALLEAEAPVLAKPVEDIAEDRNWLSHKLLNVRTIISFALAIVILVFIFTRLDINPADTWSTMLTANPFMLLLGFLIYYSAFWLRGLRWRQLIHNVGLDKDKSVNLPNVNGLVEIIYLSWFVDCIVPAKLGDAYRSYLLKRNSGVSFSSTIGTILAERVIDLLVLFGLLAASFTLVGQRLSSNSKSGDFDLGLVMLVGALMVIALIVGLVGLRFFGDLLLRFVPGKYKEKFTSFQQGILLSFKRRSLPVLLGYTILIWLCEAGRLFFVTRSLDAHAVTISAVIFIALLSSLLTTLPLTPGGARAGRGRGRAVDDSVCRQPQPGCVNSPAGQADQLLEPDSGRHYSVPVEQTEIGMAKSDVHRGYPLHPFFEDSPNHLGEGRPTPGPSLKGGGKKKG